MSTKTAVSHFNQLKAKGLILQSTSDQACQDWLRQQPHPKFYCGFDSTADSLHVGHLFLLSFVRRMQKAGFQPFIILGEATARLGDPSFKAVERDITSLETLRHSTVALEAQLQHLLSFETSTPFQILNNLSWTEGLSALDFLRDVGKHFSVNAMIQKEAIQQRLTREDRGISFTEFSYALMQAYDFYHLFQNHGVELQIGGSDQWGNMVGGSHLIKRKTHQVTHAWTLPLLLQSNGEKFGKTAEGTVWLDGTKTSPYAFYQFWFRTPDDKVWDLWEKLTTVDFETIEMWKGLWKEKQQPQRALARWMTSWVHGEEALKKIDTLSDALFSHQLHTLALEALEPLTACGLPLLKISRDQTPSLSELLVRSGLCSSLSEVKRQRDQGAIAINDAPWRSDVHGNWESFPRQIDKSASFFTLRRGKKDYALFIWEEAGSVV